MGRQEDELREEYYIRCRNEGYTADEAADRSRSYIENRFRSGKSSTSRSHLEQLYQDRLPREKPRRSHSAREKRGGRRRRTDPFDDFDNMFAGPPDWDDLDDVFDNFLLRGSFFGEGSRHRYEESPSQGSRAHEDMDGRRPCRRRGSEYRSEYRFPRCEYSSDERCSSPRGYSSEDCFPPHHYDSETYVPRDRPSQHGRENARRYTTGERPHRDYAKTAEHTYNPRGYTTEERAPPTSRYYQDGYHDSDARATPGPSRGYFTEERAPPRRYSSDGQRPRGESFTYSSRGPNHGHPRGGRHYTTEERQPPPGYSNSGSSRARARSPLRSPPPPEGIKPPTALYTVLNISRTASAADIKKAFRTMSLKWHPDRCSQADKYKATDKMAEINQAHDILSDEKKRAFYDKWGILPSSLNV